LELQIPKKIRKNNMKILKLINHPIEFRYITISILLIHAFFCVVNYSILGPNYLINGFGMALICAIDFTIVVALYFASEKNIAHIMMVTWYMLLYYCIRFAAFLFFPFGTIDFLTSDHLNDSDVTVGLFYIEASLIAIFSGIFLGTKLDVGSNNTKVFGSRISIWALSSYWIIVYMAAYYVKVVLGVTIFGAPENWGNRMGWVGIILDTDVALLITIFWGTYEGRSGRLNTKEKLILVMWILLWFIFSLVIGSRGGPLRIITIFFFAVLIINPLFKISITKFLSIFSLFLITNIFAFGIGTSLRMDAMKTKLEDKLSYSAGGFNTLSADEATLATFKNSVIRENFYKSKFVIEFAGKLSPIVTRLAVVDYPLQIISKSGNDDVLNYYMRSMHTFKNYINNMVPGEIFLESMVNTSRIFTMAYRGKSLNHINKGYASEPWSLFGLTWILAGYWGLLIMIAVPFILQTGMNYLNGYQNSFGIYIRFLYFLIPLNIAYHMFGVDHWLTVASHISIAFFIAYFIMRAIDRLFNLCTHKNTAI
jgi:hypothetical protein